MPRTAILGCVFACLLAGLSRAAEGPPSEYQVKAAFLLNFTRFIEWPAAAFGDSDSRFTICILGDDPFGPVLDEIVSGETVNTRTLGIERGRRPPFKSCQILFVSKSEKSVPKTLRDLGSGVLTVGEEDSFLREGGMIAFVIENRRVRFDINPTAAANAGLKLSSKLLSVARSVEK